MPFISQAQLRYFAANREKLRSEGVDVDHWFRETKGKKLPKRATKKTASFGQRVALRLQVAKLASSPELLAFEEQRLGLKVADFSLDSVQKGISSLGEKLLPIGQDLSAKAGDVRDSVIRGLADPSTRALYAAGLGAAGGGLMGVLAESASGRRHKKRLTSAITGAVGGGLLGGVMGHLSKEVPTPNWLSGVSQRFQEAAGRPTLPAVEGPLAEAAKLREELLAIDSRSPIRQIYDSTLQFGADHPLGSIGAVGATAAGGAASAYDRARDWASVPKGDTTSSPLARYLGRQSYVTALERHGQLGKVLADQLAPFSFKPETVHQHLASDRNFVDMLRRGKVDQSAFTRRLENAWSAQNPTKAAPQVGASRWAQIMDELRSLDMPKPVNQTERLSKALSKLTSVNKAAAGQFAASPAMQQLLSGQRSPELFDAMERILGWRPSAQQLQDIADDVLNVPPATNAGVLPQFAKSLGEYGLKSDTVLGQLGGDKSLTERLLKGTATADELEDFVRRAWAAQHPAQPMPNISAAQRANLLNSLRAEGQKLPGPKYFRTGVSTGLGLATLSALGSMLFKSNREAGG